MFSELPLIADVVASQPRDCLQPHFGVENVCGCPPSGMSELSSLTGDRGWIAGDRPPLLLLRPQTVRCGRNESFGDPASEMSL